MVKKYCFVSIALLFIMMTQISVRANTDNLTHFSLLEVTDEIRIYANETVKPKISNTPQKDRLSQFLGIISILLDPKYGISSNRLAPPDFMILAQKSRQQVISPNSPLLEYLPERKREIVRILHNKYMINQVTGIFFGPSASDIIKYKSAFGCSHYARAFIAVVKALELVKTPTDLRYVISSKHDDYNKCVELKGNNCPTINGHQFVLVKIQNNWIALNTNRKNDFVVLPKGFTPDINLKKTNIPIVFKKIPGIIFLLRKIGKDYSDDSGDNSLVSLTNISRSGEATSSELVWDRFNIQENVFN
jgi:hypothetical protein